VNGNEEQKLDLLCRVFQGKLEEFRRLCIKDKIFGNVRNLVSMTEFQKRGIPHAHILLTTDKKVCFCCTLG
jgi:hypothetical protein